MSLTQDQPKAGLFKSLHQLLLIDLFVCVGVGVMGTRFPRTKRQNCAPHKISPSLGLALYFSTEPHDGKTNICI